MAKDLCVNGALDAAKYSSPVPLIGLYIMGATLVCFISMVCDILYGIRRRKPWLPCRFFSLNSLTLTLLSIATKLPVDLTTSMPSSLDQLSKLTGTAFICISMGFFMPSLGTMSDKDGLANMASLTILVLAVVVNVCIQISTGLIFAFIVEHVIILFCMLSLLLVLWFSMLSINSMETIHTDQKSNLFLKGATRGHGKESSMIQRLKLCYVYRYTSNPQLVLFQTSYCSYIGILCTLCSVILSEAVLRSLFLKEFKFCEGVSDYRWSMKMVVVMQIFTVVVGSLATVFRWLTFVTHLDLWGFLLGSFLASLFCIFEFLTPFHLHFLAIKFSRMSFLKIFRLLEVLVIFLVLLIQTGLSLTSGLVVWSSLKVRDFFVWAMKNIENCCGIFLYKHKDGGHMDSLTEEFQDVSDEIYEEGLEKWLLGIAMEDMNRWMEVNNKIVSPNHLVQLLLKIPASQESLAKHIERRGREDFSEYRVSCLTMVYLVILATISIPSTLSDSLIHTLDEALEIIHFIDRKMNAVRLENKIKWRNAKELWMARDIITHWVQSDTIKTSVEKNVDVVSNGVPQPQKDLHHAVGIISKLEDHFDILGYKEVSIIKDVIDEQQYASIKELYDHMEKIFVDMLHFFLTQLPLAIFKDVAESPAEECEKSVRLAMKFLCKLKSLEDTVQWSFPDGSNITSLLITHAPTTDTNDGTQVEGGVDTIALPVTEDVGDIVPTIHNETIEEIV